MFDDVPARVWLLLFIATVAWAPARYVFRHVLRSSSRRDITQPAENLSWRSSRALTRNIAILAGLAMLTVFIFTPAASAFAQSPSFLPILLAGLGGFALWSVARGFASGVIEPMMRGTSWEFNRAEHPKRYWASMGWNGLLGGSLLFFGGKLVVDAPIQALRDRCYDWKIASSPAKELSACNRLLAKTRDDDQSDALAARGSAFYRLGDYRRAGVDYAAAVRLDPQDSSSHYNLGLVHEQLGNRERAVADYGMAVRIDPKNADAFANRGLIYLDTGRFEQAIADLTHAHDLQPTNVAPLANRGLAYAWKNDPSRAEQDFTVVRKSEPANSTLLHGEGLLAVAQGDVVGGVRLFSDAIARDPSDAWAIEMRAELYRHLSEREKMRADAAAARQSEKAQESERR